MSDRTIFDFKPVVSAADLHTPECVEWVKHLQGYRFRCACGYQTQQHRLSWGEVLQVAEGHCDEGNLSDS